MKSPEGRPAGMIPRASKGGFGGQEGFMNPITGASASMMADAGEYCDSASSVREYSY